MAEQPPKQLEATEEKKVDERTRLLQKESSIKFPSKSTTALFRPLQGSISLADVIPFFSQYKQTIILTRVLLAFYTVCFFLCIFGIVCYFIPILDLIVGFSTIIILTWIGSLCSMKMTYEWSFIEERTLSDLKKAADDMQQQRESLHASKGELGEQVDGLQSTVYNLKYDASELETNMKDYEDLQAALQERAKENETIADMLNSFDAFMDRMHDMRHENSKAQLLSMYYETAFRDDEAGLSRQEYHRFIKQLDTETRAIFEQFDGFEKYDANKNGVIEFEEFCYLLEEVMQEIHERECNEAHHSDDHEHSTTNR